MAHAPAILAAFGILRNSLSQLEALGFQMPAHGC
jgi:hypothetical protein